MYNTASPSYKMPLLLTPAVHAIIVFFVLFSLSGIFLFLLFQKHFEKDVHQVADFHRQNLAAQLSQIEENEYSLEGSLRFLAGFTDISVEIMLGLCRTFEGFTQLSFIDNAGREVIKVTRSAAGCRQTAESRLQDKYSAGYAQEGLQLPPGYYYSCPIQPEDGREPSGLPREPVRRMVTSMDNGSGLLVIDLLEHKMLRLGRAVDPFNKRSCNIGSHHPLNNCREGIVLSAPGTT